MARLARRGGSAHARRVYRRHSTQGPSLPCDMAWGDSEHVHAFSVHAPTFAEMMGSSLFHISQLRKQGSQEKFTRTGHRAHTAIRAHHMNYSRRARRHAVHRRRSRHPHAARRTCPSPPTSRTIVRATSEFLEIGRWLVELGCWRFPACCPFPQGWR